MNAIGPLVCIVVVLWLILTLAYQYDRVQVAIGRLDPFKLLPSWAFFAPNPAYRDLHIVVRELRANGTLGPCTPICFFPDRSLGHLFWNPAKRPRKILQDAVQSMKRFRRWSASEKVLQCSLPYLLILHYVTTQYSRGPDAVAVQFAVIETSGWEDRRIWITFLSGFHRLSPASASENSGIP
jgi:hypothetical protein